MKVDAPQEEAESDVEDDISEPDEDTIAGQMAMMKGQPVRRTGQHQDDDDDDSEAPSDQDDDEDESDSDSDSSSSDDSSSSSDSDSD